MNTAGKMTCATDACALLHSALASRAAKRSAAAVAGPQQAHSAYRLFYVGQSPLSFWLLLTYGSMLPTRTLYQLDGPAALLLRAGQAAGFAHLFAATRPSGLLRLAGWRNLQARRQRLPPPPGPVAQGPKAGPHGALHEGGPCRWSRHPLNFSGMPIFWRTPPMTTRWLAFSLVSSVHSVIGSLHEEARLEAAAGKRYRHYRRSGVPFFWPRAPALRRSPQGASHAY